MFKQFTKYHFFIITAIAFVVVILLVIFNTLPNKIARKAFGFVGQEEKTGNSGFYNAAFEMAMKSIGWSKSAQWCAYFAKLVWLSILKGELKELAENLISGSSQQTWKNFNNDKSGYFEITTDKPKHKGALAIWQSKTDATKGHVGIVISDINKKFFRTIEGNSNVFTTELKDFNPFKKKYSEKEKSEGIVAEHIREYDGDGMKLLGFINIK